MGLDVYSRREYKQGKFVYLLDDKEKTESVGEMISANSKKRTPFINAVFLQRKKISRYK